MFRMSPSDVVNAYKTTGIIPVRKVWQTPHGRGGCAFDVIARSLNIENGEAWSSQKFAKEYVDGFNEAWDADDPEVLDKSAGHKAYLIGYWDAILCREAVESAFASVAETKSS